MRHPASVTLAIPAVLASAGCSTIDSVAMPSDPTPVSMVAASDTVDYRPGSSPEGQTVTTEAGTQTGNAGAAGAGTATGGQGLPAAGAQAANAGAVTGSAQTAGETRPPAGTTGMSARPAEDVAKPAPPAIGRGIAYFLPRQLAKVTIKRTELALDKQIKALGSAELASSAAKAAVTTLKAEIKATEDTLVTRGDVPAVRDLLLSRLAEQRKDLAKAEAAASEKDKALVEARTALVTATRDGGTGKAHSVAVGVELLAPSPDPAFGFRLQPRHSILRDDDHKLSVGPTGLLNSVEVVAVDRTGDALVELATFAGAISNPLAGRRGILACPGKLPEEITAIVDFADRESVDDLNAKAACLGARLTTREQDRLFTRTAHPGEGHQYNGIVYRSPNEVLVNIEKCQDPEGKCAGNEGWFPAQVLALMLPQAGPVSYVNQDAGFLTPTKYSVVLKDGILTTYNSNRPSEVAHAAALPMRIFQGVADGVSKVISIRTGRNTSEAGYYDSEASLTRSRLGAASSGTAAQGQLAGERTALLETLLRDRARRDAIQRCSALLDQGLPLEACDLDD